MFLIAIRSYSRAVSLLFSKKFWWFMLFPIAFSALALWGGNQLASYPSATIADTANTLLSSVSWLAWITESTSTIVRVILSVANFLFMAYFGGYVLLALMSPIYSWLSERVESHLTGREYNFSIAQLLRDITRGIYIALRCSVQQLLIGILLFALSFVPVLGFVTPLLAFVTSAYFYGFAFVDYAVERKDMSTEESFDYLRKKKPLLIGIGSVFSLALLLPVLNIVACGFVSLLSVIASVIALEEVAE